MSLDKHPICGRQQVNYSQFVEPLWQNGIRELSDVVMLSIDDLQQFMEMTYGDASQLLHYATEDNEELLLHTKHTCFKD